MTYEFERDSNGFEGVRENYSYRIEGDFCYGFVLSKLPTGQLKTNSRTRALSYNQFYMDATLCSGLVSD
jgi:hypothetical protein